MFSKNPAFATAYAGVAPKRRTAKQRAQVAPPVVPLNTKLHLKIVAEGSAKPSTLESALAALKRIRSERGG